MRACKESTSLQLFLNTHVYATVGTGCVDAHAHVFAMHQELNKALRAGMPPHIWNGINQGLYPDIPMPCLYG